MMSMLTNPQMCIHACPYIHKHYNIKKFRRVSGYSKTQVKLMVTDFTEQRNTGPWMIRIKSS